MLLCGQKARELCTGTFAEEGRALGALGVMS